MEKRKVTLYVVDWKGTTPSIVSAEGTQQGKLYRFDTRAGLPFKCRLLLTLEEAEQMCIGESAVDAAYLAMQDYAQREKELELKLVDVRRRVTELAVLGLAESGV